MVNVAIAPDPSTPCATDLPSRSWIYEVQPAHALPTLDLSITLKSRFLSVAARQRFDRLLRRRRGLMLVAYACTTMLYIIVMVTPPRVAQGLSAIGLLLGLPGTFFIMSALRYDTIRELLPTYDFVFFDTIVVSTLVVMMAMLHDARVLVVVQALVAYQINIFIDANIQALHRVALVNAFAMLMSAFVGICITLGITPQLHHFVLLEFGSHKLEARAFVTDGFVTIVAIMLRNTYRKKALLLSKSTGAVVDCVSYRCHLKIELFVPAPTIPQSITEGATLLPVPTPVHIQTMRYVASLPLIDARCVVVPRLFLWLITPTRVRVKQLLVQTLGMTSALLVLGVGVYKFANHHGDNDNGANEEHVARITMVVAVALTCLYTVACLMLYQRELLHAIATSFDFVFLSTQLTFVHVATADFFCWNDLTLLLVAAWLWSHWVFCVDALTPVVRDRIGLGPLFIKMVMAALVASAGILNHLLLFSEASVHIYDRVLWTGTLLGQAVEFRLLASFYSAYVTVMAWALRLLWRIATAKRNEFVLLDGAVAYDNYLRQPSTKLSSRLASRFAIAREAVKRTHGRLSIGLGTSPTPIMIETNSTTSAGVRPLRRDR